MEDIGRSRRDCFITSKIESHMAVQDESIVLFYNEVDTSVSAMCHVTLIMIY
jgi:hypothetical protein